MKRMQNIKKVYCQEIIERLVTFSRRPGAKQFYIDEQLLIIFIIEKIFSSVEELVGRDKRRNANHIIKFD